tara:strand:+ start:2579 stop:3307 length:729 start_codon:yes stop_codon:yes gene_type:complete
MNMKTKNDYNKMKAFKRFVADVEKHWTSNGVYNNDIYYTQYYVSANSDTGRMFLGLRNRVTGHLYMSTHNIVTKNPTYTISATLEETKVISTNTLSDSSYSPNFIRMLCDNLDNNTFTVNKDRVKEELGLKRIKLKQWDVVLITLPILHTDVLHHFDSSRIPRLNQYRHSHLRRIFRADQYGWLSDDDYVVLMALDDVVSMRASSLLEKENQVEIQRIHDFVNGASVMKYYGGYKDEKEMIV